MRKSGLPRSLCCILLLVLAVMVGDIALAEEKETVTTVFHYPGMRPGREKLRQWSLKNDALPRVTIDPAIEAELMDAELRGASSSKNLLSHLKYDATERDQGSCGNCWVWASTGIMEIALDVQFGIHDRLSVQYLNSCMYASDDDYACCGGSIDKFADWYTDSGQWAMIPWSNNNGYFVDDQSSCCDYCSPGRTCGYIGKNPSYPFLSLEAQQIPTQDDDISQAKAISNIKNVLNQKRGVYYGFSAANASDWSKFNNYFGSKTEDDIWNPDVLCGSTWNDDTGVSHAVLIVGYDDSAPTPYWLVLNSWGAPDGRPNGLFKMKMHMNYKCQINDSPLSGDYAHRFNTLKVGYAIMPSLPWAPLNAWAEATGSQKAKISFDRPDSGGGIPISSYKVTSKPGGLTVSGSKSPITMAGLTNGTAYTFSVKAKNAIGYGPASEDTYPVVPGTKPGAPTDVHGAGGNAQATVTFHAPASDGGASVTKYTVVASPGGATATATSVKPVVVTGLTNGKTYTFKVKATNDWGTGPLSAASNPVYPATVPNAPTGVTAKGGDSLAWVGWPAPSSNGGGQILYYTVTSNPDGITKKLATNSGSIDGLTNGTAYTFTVTASNKLGTSPASAPSNSVTPARLPDAPTGVTAVAWNADAVVSFTLPASNGGSPITKYMAVSTPGNISMSGTSSPITVTGLTNGKAYTFKVRATNGVGDGPYSTSSNSVTPLAVPGAPKNVAATAGDKQATITFYPPPLPNVPVTNYTATSSPGGLTATANSSPIVFSGLTNGTTYTFAVTANNSFGHGPPATTNSVTPMALPGAPTGVLATPGDKKVWVTFTAPDNGGSAITAYTATSSPGGITGSGPGSPVTVNGLTNGTSYTFTVTATNAKGTGPKSSPSNAAIPGTLPGAPTGVTATAGNAQATVSFSPPASDGGNPISSYSATSSPGGLVGTGGGSPITVSGLTNGTAYTFTVRAFNAIGTGPASSPSNSVTPKTVPGVPTGVTATAGNAQATVSFSPPASNGGSPITLYTVTSTPGNVAATGGGSPITVSGLTNGTAYTFTVKARNAAGDSAASNVSNSVTPATVPGAPTVVSATPGNAQVTVAFSPPASNGGSPIISYTVSSGSAVAGGVSATGTTSPITVTGLTNGRAYTFTVKATNAIGTGPASSPSESVTPITVPEAPTNVIATPWNAQAYISFSAPASDGGSPITLYTATSDPGGFTGTRTDAAGSITVNGLTNGTAYTFTVKATNAAGTGPASSPSNSVTPIFHPTSPRPGR